MASADAATGLAAFAGRTAARLRLPTAGRSGATVIDALVHTKWLVAIGAEAAAAEAAGHGAVWVSETGNDPFLHSYAAATATSSAEIGTAIAVAFARSPMTVAQTAWQLADVSGGRFRLGLGSQVKAHIERRFSMPWGRPVEQMRDFLDALSAIWESVAHR